MNADKFFEKYSIEEISHKTKISPISLRLIKNKEFDKIPKAKFMGFIKIIEKEFNINLDELKEEYLNSINEKEEPIKEEIKAQSNNNFLFIGIGLLLLIIGGYFLSKHIPKQEKEIINSTPTKEINQPINSTQNSSSFINENNNKVVKEEENKEIEKNTTNQIKIINNTIKPSISKNTTQTHTPKNTPTPKNNTTKEKITIIPYEKIWFKALNIDTNKTFEYLTSHIKTLPKGNYYIKFGHGNVSILYNEFNITPNTKKIIRILLKDGNYTFLKKPNEFEK